MADFKERATAGLQYALLEVPEGPGRYKRIADIMNERGIKTLRGGKWTAENIRKRLKRGELSFGTGEVEESLSHIIVLLGSRLA